MQRIEVENGVANVLSRNIDLVIKVCLRRRLIGKVKSSKKELSFSYEKELRSCAGKNGLVIISGESETKQCAVMLNE